MRFKPPPLKNNADKSMGWRVEFRPMELQFTDFENSSFCAFVILLTQAIKQFGYNFLMPISKIDANLKRAQHRNACLEEKFYFRRNIDSSEIKNTAEQSNCDLVEMSLDEIVNGSAEFKGLIPIVLDYLELMDNLEPLTSCKFKQYLRFIKKRADGSLLTPASYIRKFVANHPAYKHDSIVNNEVNYDLLWNVHLISNQQIECPELIYKIAC
jgi:glutamate--cysteine ligase catalytic subunit